MQSGDPKNIELERLLQQNRELKKDSVDQWASNHYEHCGVPIPPWPHEGDCQWPIPATLASSEVFNLLLLLVSGPPVGFQL